MIFYSLQQNRRDIEEMWLNTILSAKPDVAIVPGISEKYETLCEKIYKQGTELIMLDIESTCRKSAYLGSDNQKIGEKAAELALQKADRINAAVIMRRKENKNFEVRRQSFEETLSQYENCKVKVCIEDASTRVAAMEKIENMIEKNPDINFIFCTDSITRQAAALVIGE